MDTFASLEPIQRVMFDLFDNNDYQNRLIAINKINFLKGDDTDDSDFVISGSGGGIYEPENLTATATSTNQINLTWNRGLNPPEYANLRYRIYRNDLAITTTANTNYSNTNLSSSTQYCYKVTAYIDDNESDYSNADCAVTQILEIPLPIANFSSSPTFGDAPLYVVFTDTSTGAGIYKYSWIFDDEYTCLTKNATHIFQNSGEYAIRHQVTNSTGSNTRIRYITVYDPIT